MVHKLNPVVSIRATNKRLSQVTTDLIVHKLDPVVSIRATNERLS